MKDRGSYRMMTMKMRMLLGTESRLPALTVNEQLDFEEMTAIEKFTRHAPRYTEASLVKNWKNLASNGQAHTLLLSVRSLKEVILKKEIRKEPKGTSAL